MKALRSISRSTPLLVYNANNLTFNKVIFGYKNLAEFLSVHENTAKRAVSRAQVYAEKYILSLKELSRIELEEIKTKVITKSTIVRKILCIIQKKTVLLKEFPSVNNFMNFSGLSGSAIKDLCESETKLWLAEFFISYDLIPEADNTITGFEEFNPKIGQRIPGHPVYTYSSNGKFFIKRYSSLRACVADLDGSRNVNTKTLLLRIKHKELYHGLRVSFTPLFNHPDDSSDNS
jgi:hypothetical protein